MDTNQPFATDAGKIVYVKEVDVATLPKSVQKEAGDLDQLYAVHNADGEQLALVANRKLAFALALQNDMRPQAVH